MNLLHKIIAGYEVIEYDKMNIFIIKNVFEDDFCNELISLIKTLPLTKSTYGEHNNVLCNVINLNDSLLIDDEMYYNFPTDVSEYTNILENIEKKEFITNKLNGITHDELVSYNSKLTQKMGILNDIMIELKLGKVHFDNTGYILRQIVGETRLHSDGLNEIYDSNVNFIKGSKNGQYKMIRNASVIFTLNDDFEGGIFEFPYHDVTIKLEKGSAVMFPPFWTHPHKTTELLNGTVRYTVNTWTCQYV
jgi:hypothetical protein